MTKTPDGPVPSVDWVRGGDSLVFQSCRHCAARWYFRRGFCPRCGADDPREQPSNGQGCVHAVTTLHRAPDPAWRDALPYTLALVDLDDGFRALGHGAATLAIGDRVVVTIRTVAGRRLPWFAPA